MLESDAHVACGVNIYLIFYILFWMRSLLLITKIIYPYDTALFPNIGKR